MKINGFDSEIQLNHRISFRVNDRRHYWKFYWYKTTSSNMIINCTLITDQPWDSEGLDSGNLFIYLKKKY